MWVYRIEDPLGRGPYTSDMLCPSVEKLRLKHNSDESRNNSRPGALDDFYPIVGLRHIYGCPSLSKLRRWFGPFIGELILDGFRLVRYDVPEQKIRVSKSGKQVAFLPHYEKVMIR